MKDLIFALRVRMNLNQSDFGQFFGVKRDTVSSWETGSTSNRDLEIGIRIGIAAMKAGLPVEEIVAFSGLDDCSDRPLRVAEPPAGYEPGDC